MSTANVPRFQLMRHTVIYEDDVSPQGYNYYLIGVVNDNVVRRELVYSTLSASVVSSSITAHDITADRVYRNILNRNQ